uniref:Uncharacterized protein n=1 Tax=Meloidogyne hapla TaxID=6305 RepID=A0A1I8BB70_MELHA
MVSANKNHFEGYGNEYVNEEQNFGGIGLYPTGHTKFLNSYVNPKQQFNFDFGNIHHHLHQNSPPTPKFSNYDEETVSNSESVSIRGTGRESNAPGYDVNTVNHFHTMKISEPGKQFISMIDKEEEEEVLEELERTRKLEAEGSSSTLTEEDSLDVSFDYSKKQHAIGHSIRGKKKNQKNLNKEKHQKERRDNNLSCDERRDDKLKCLENIHYGQGVHLQEGNDSTIMHYNYEMPKNHNEKNHKNCCKIL